MYSFQSYLSPIQTSYPSSLATAFITFNPTLVQFKRRPGADHARTAPTFNPTLVQFKRTAPGSPCAACGCFQSYLSPIQTLIPDWCPLEQVAPFNPTLVQFKPYPFRAASVAPDFQSYLSPIQTAALRVNLGGTEIIFQSYLSPIQTDPRERGADRKILSILP